MNADPPTFPKRNVRQWRRRGWLATGGFIAVSILAIYVAGRQGAAQTLEVVCSGNVQAFRAPPFETFDTGHNDLISAEEAESCTALSSIFSELERQ